MLGWSLKAAWKVIVNIDAISLHLKVEKEFVCIILRLISSNKTDSVSECLLINLVLAISMFLG